MNHAVGWPALGSGQIAFTAAVLFGISTPWVQRYGVGIGSLALAAQL